MFKYAFFLVVAFCAVQGFQARHVTIDERGIDDVINTIKAVMEKIKDTISHIVTTIPEIIKNIQNKINEIIDKVNLPGLIAKIKEEIENLIELGEAGKKCVDAERDEIDALIQNAQTGMTTCVSNAQSEASGLAAELSKLIEQANEIREGLSNRVIKCIEDNKLNPIGMYNCFQSQIGPIGEELADFEQQIKNAFLNAEQIAEQAVINLGKCVEKVRDDTIAQEQKIMNDITECMNLSA